MLLETMNDPSFHPTARDVISYLRRRFPDTPFLALGQTALWDEPTKASFRRLLDQLWPEARLIAGAHDSDYFAKVTGHPAAADSSKYAIVPHDDALTRGLWSAAGEMSRLFGSENVPTSARLQQAGVSLPKALRGSEDPVATLGDLTEAWGWTGIIRTESGSKIAHDVLLRDILSTLLDQVEWATRGTAECLEGERYADALVVGATMRGWIYTYSQSHPNASLSDLYRDLYPRFYELLLGAPPANVSTSNTLRLLRFNTSTATLPRFALLDRFLRPETRKAAIDAYNLAVSGTEMYTLDRFGDGALPFDLVIPGRGRGTLCIHNGTVTVTAQPDVTLCAPCDIGSAEQLAALIERELGQEVAVVGKAIALIPMLAAEFLVVFHEGASGYTHRTRDLMAGMAKRGVSMPELRPIVRIRYRTWDALEVLGDTGRFALPEHLAQAFARPTISAGEFAACWRCACTRETRRLEDLAKLKSPRALLAYLGTLEPGRWNPLAEEYQAARMRLLSVWDRAQGIQGRVYTLYDQVKELKAELVSIEREKGDDFRERVIPLQDRRRAATDDAVASRLEAEIEGLQKERAARYDHAISERLSQIRFALATIRELKEKRLTRERGPEATGARQTMQRIEGDAELTRARIARNAIRVVEGLPHTDHRPSSWWFPSVDPSGAWFARLTETAEYYLEEVSASSGERDK